MSRVQKQIIIGLAFVLIIGGLGFGFVDYFFIIESSCFDGVQNGQEEGADCGLVACGVACDPEILPLNIVSQKLIEVGSGDYDFIAQINNPNALFGASSVRYEADLLKIDGEIMKETGTFYILPGQTRFLVIQSIISDVALVSAFLDVTEAEWKRVDSFETINFITQRKNYTVTNRNGVYSELEGVVLNDSDYDFDKVEIGIILFDDGNNIIAVNKTDIRTFLSKTERYFKVSWPAELPSIARQDIEVLTNVFENANFIKNYGTQERFQKYY